MSFQGVSNNFLNFVGICCTVSLFISKFISLYLLSLMIHVTRVCQSCLPFQRVNSVHWFIHCSSPHFINFFSDFNYFFIYWFCVWLAHVFPSPENALLSYLFEISVFFNETLVVINLSLSNVIIVSNKFLTCCFLFHSIVGILNILPFLVNYYNTVEYFIFNLH